MGVQLVVIASLFAVVGHVLLINVIQIILQFNFGVMCRAMMCESSQCYHGNIHLFIIVTLIKAKTDNRTNLQLLSKHSL